MPNTTRAKGSTKKAATKKAITKQSSSNAVKPTFDLDALIRPNIREMVGYSSARSEFSGAASVFLDANENAFGSPLTAQKFNRYPDPQQRALKTKLAAIKHVRPENIFLGNGSDEAIDLLIRAFVEPTKESILITPPTYGMYEVSATIHNARLLRAPLTNTFEIDMNALRCVVKPTTKLLFLCSPNNPSGNALQRESIEEVLAWFHGLVILDEAYIDFAPHTSFLPRLAEFENLVVMQTLSKAWGLASLRLGMAFASTGIISVMNKIKPPYNISAAVQSLALDALGNEAWKTDHVAEVITERAWLTEALQRVHSVEHVFPSDANFLLVRVRNPKAMYRFLIERGVVVRDRSSLPQCEGCLRITVGTAEENKSLIAALNDFERTI
jgi:histidinol-phosphate aminotransferase